MLILMVLEGPRGTLPKVTLCRTQLDFKPEELDHGDLTFLRRVLLNLFPGA